MPEDLVLSPRAPPLLATSDAALIQGTLAGDRQSFDALINRHQASLLRMILRHLRNTEDAEDALQQVFLKAYQHLAGFRSESKFYTWLYTIALNVVRNTARQRKIRRMDSIDIAASPDAVRAPQWSDNAPALDDSLGHRMDVAVVLKAVEELNELQRAIFTLHYIQHLSLKDVAARVQRPMTTVKVYLHRARKNVFARVTFSVDNGSESI